MIVYDNTVIKSYTKAGGTIDHFQIVNIPAKWRFATVAERDTYFTSHLDELKPRYTLIIVAADLQIWDGLEQPQQYDNSRWMLASWVIKGDRGPKGQEGKTGQKGEKGDKGDKGDPGSGGGGVPSQNVAYTNQPNKFIHGQQIEKHEGDLLHIMGATVKTVTPVGHVTPSDIGEIVIHKYINSTGREVNDPYIAFGTTDKSWVGIGGASDDIIKRVHDLELKDLAVTEDINQLDQSMNDLGRDVGDAIKSFNTDLDIVKHNISNLDPRVGNVEKYIQQINTELHHDTAGLDAVNKKLAEAELKIRTLETEATDYERRLAILEKLIPKIDANETRSMNTAAQFKVIDDMVTHGVTGLVATRAKVDSNWTSIEKTEEKVMDHEARIVHLEKRPI